MRRYHLFALAATLAVIAIGSALPTRAADDKPAPIDLFNGKDLEGWRVFLSPDDKSKAKPEEVFTVKDGVLECTGKPFGYIITKKEYSDYKLEVEWKWPEKAGNSGVFVHVSGPDKIWPKGAEAQLWSGYAGDFWLVDGFKLTVDKTRQDPKSARHFYRMKTAKPVEKKVGDWNKYEITCKGDTISLVVNGVKVNEGTEAEASKGKILLQSEGAPVHFRNIKLTPLK